MSQDIVQAWETEQGVEFLKKTGIEPGWTVVDFGCKSGHYTFPSAQLVGKDGMVYAVDCNLEVLEDISDRVEAGTLKNIVTLENSGALDADIEPGSVDAVLLYDVLHFFKAEDRIEFYQSVYTILRPKGILSVYPKHCQGDDPRYGLRDVSFSQIKREIQSAGFWLNDIWTGALMHDEELVRGRVLNFIK